jgi:hypothetical protein
MLHHSCTATSFTQHLMCIWFTTQVHSSQQCLPGAYHGPVITVGLTQLTGHNMLRCHVVASASLVGVLRQLGAYQTARRGCAAACVRLHTCRCNGPIQHRILAGRTPTASDRRRRKHRHRCCVLPGRTRGLDCCGVALQRAPALKVARMSISALTVQHFVCRSGVQPGGSAAAHVEEAGAAAQGLPCACCARMGTLHPQPQSATLVHTNSGHQ